MKKILFTLLLMSFVGSLCFAQQPTAPASQSTAKIAETKTFTGKVDFIIVADPVKRTRSELTVANDNGQKMLFRVSDATHVIDKNGRTAAFAKITTNNKVVIEYITTKAGNNRAQSIKVVE
jgi:hypothetical protein